METASKAISAIFCHGPARAPPVMSLRQGRVDDEVCTFQGDTAVGRLLKSQCGASFQRIPVADFERGPQTVCVDIHEGDGIAPQSRCQADVLDERKREHPTPGTNDGHLRQGIRSFKKEYTVLLVDTKYRVYVAACQPE